MSRLSRLREGFPVTFAGMASLGLGAGTFWFQGVKRLDMVLLCASALAVILVTGLALVTLLGAWFLSSRLVDAPGPVTLECGGWGPTGFRAPLPPWLPFLAVRVVWESPSGVRPEVVPGEGTERAFPLRRGRCPGVVRIVRVGDILGLTEFGWRVSGSVPLRILPARAALDPGAALHGLAHGEDVPDPRGGPLGDRVDMRKYGHGDPLRMILWKTYARTRKAFVRIPERALEPVPRVCAYVPASAWDEPAARRARTLVERDLLGPGWRLGADGADDAHTAGEALEALAVSGSWTGPCGLGAFLGRARNDGFGACILLLPAREGPWTSALQEALADPPLRVHAVFALEGWNTPEPALWRRWVLEPSTPAGSTPGEVLGLMDRTVTASMGATLVDTEGGGVLDQPQAYLRKLAGRPA